MAKQTNASTGASAASSTGGSRGVEVAAVGSSQSAASTDDDVGDGKNSSLVQSCPQFRNELGGEDERTVAMTRRVAEQLRTGARSFQWVDTVISSTCNGVAVLDCSAGSDGTVEPPLRLYSNFVLEYIDQGAFYYRRFFYDHGKPAHLSIVLSGC